MLNPELAANRRPIDRLSRNTWISRLGERVQPFVATIVTSAGVPVANVLHGTVLGHPLHAMLTDIPVGAWTVTAALDTLELLGAPRNPGSDTALAIGLAGAAGAVLTGWADWSDTDKDARTLGLAHALVNGTAVTAYLAALPLRSGKRRRLGLLLSLAAYGLVSGGAYIGGELSYGLMLGSKHTAQPLIPLAEFTPVLDASELGSSQPASADVQGVPLLISRAADGVAAISAICTHRGAPLADGEFAGGCVRCPWHGSTFALDDGHVIDGPATFPQPRFEARVNGDKIEVRALEV